MSSPGIPDLQFVANRWLAVGEGDGNTHVTLLPSNGAGGLKLVKYRVHVSFDWRLADRTQVLAAAECAGIVRGAPEIW